MGDRGLVMCPGVVYAWSVLVIALGMNYGLAAITNRVKINGVLPTAAPII